MERNWLYSWCRAVLDGSFSSLYQHNHEIDGFEIRAAGIALARGLDIDLPEVCRFDYDDAFRRDLSTDPISVIMDSTENDQRTLLHVADYLLASELASDYDARQLELLLRGSNSAWRMNVDWNGLSLLVPVEELAELDLASAGGDSSAKYIADAWDAAWRTEDPNAVKAYDSAVKAIESILVPIVIPKHPTPTLGRVIKALQAKPEKWDTRFRGSPTVEALAAMLEEVWKTQVRHGKSEYLENTLEEAQDAVTIAVAVVGLCRRGFLERLNEYTPEEEAEDLAIADAALERYQSANMKTVPYEEVIADWAAEESSS